MSPVAQAAAAASTQDLLEVALAELIAALETGDASRREIVLRKYPQYDSALREHANNCAAIDEVASPVINAAKLAQELPQIEGYDMLECLAIGGMGIVYRAHHQRLNHVVALKVMRRDRLFTADAVQRFRAEAEVAYRLEHRNIISICDVGETQGQPYYAMKLVEGGSLKQMLEEHGPFDSKTAAQIIREVAEAIKEAHDSHIVHRDLKPGNILIDSTGAPRIIDFGLARLMGQENQLTGFVGTPGYASPEQTDHRSEEAGPAADVYSLGVVLYELLTGKLPVERASATPMGETTCDLAPVPLRVINHRISINLEAICLQCLKQDPAKRYADAGALAADLQRYLDGEDVLAQRDSYLDRLLSRFITEQTNAFFTKNGPWMLFYAGIATVCIMALQVLMVGNWPWAEWVAWPIIVISWLPVFPLLRSDSNREFWPSNPAERMLWSIWCGVVLAHAATLVTMRLSHPNFVDAFSAAFRVLPILTGLGFFIMGSSFSKRNALWGVSWMLLAIAAAVLVPPLLLPLTYAIFNIINVAFLARDQFFAKDRLTHKLEARASRQH